jgi:hypothetical protein
MYFVRYLKMINFTLRNVRHNDEHSYDRNRLYICVFLISRRERNEKMLSIIFSLYLYIDSKQARSLGVESRDLGRFEPTLDWIGKGLDRLDLM